MCSVATSSALSYFIVVVMAFGLEFMLQTAFAEAGRFIIPTAEGSSCIGHFCLERTVESISHSK